MLRASDTEDPFYLVVVKLPARMDLGERDKGLLDGLCCAFSATCINRQLKSAAGRREPLGVLCRVPQASDGPSSLDALGPLKRTPAFLNPASQTAFATCAINKYGLALKKNINNPK